MYLSYHVKQKSIHTIKVFFDTLLYNFFMTSARRGKAEFGGPGRIRAIKGLTGKKNISYFFF